MEHLKKILILFLLSIISSCASKKYIGDYEPINIFLETQKLDKNRKYVLQSNKETNKQALRIFNGDEGLEHVIDPNASIDYTGGLFIEKHWKKEDFPQYNFILEKGTGLVFKQDFLLRYMNTGINEILAISEPIYYMNKKYVLFYFGKTYFEGGGNSQVVIMKKENNKWIIVKIIGDYIFS
jgi:hypothetical protein